MTLKQSLLFIVPVSDEQAARIAAEHSERRAKDDGGMPRRAAVLLWIVILHASRLRAGVRAIDARSVVPAETP